MEIRDDGVDRVLRISGAGEAAWFYRDLRNQELPDDRTLRWSWRVLEAPPTSGPRLLHCRSFAVVSPGTSGHTTAGKRAPMLGKWPNPNKLSGKIAPAGGLWIRRVLVRAQEGQSSPATT